MTGILLEAAENNAKQATIEKDVLKKQIADLIKGTEKPQKSDEDNEVAKQ